MRVVEMSSLRPYKAPTTGVYVGPGQDSRFYKAGSDIPPSYRFSHERGAVPPPPAARRPAAGT